MPSNSSGFIEFPCSQCAQTLSVPAADAEATMHCPACGSLQEVPERDTSYEAALVPDVIAAVLEEPEDADELTAWQRLRQGLTMLFVGIFLFVGSVAANALGVLLNIDAQRPERALQNRDVDDAALAETVALVFQVVALAGLVCLFIGSSLASFGPSKALVSSLAMLTSFATVGLIILVIAQILTLLNKQLAIQARKADVVLSLLFVGGVFVVLALHAVLLRQAASVVNRHVGGATLLLIIWLLAPVLLLLALLVVRSFAAHPNDPIIVASVQSTAMALLLLYMVYFMSLAASCIGTLQRAEARA